VDAAALIGLMALQTLVLVGLVRFADLNENEPLALVALLCAWGATGALAIAVVLDALIVDRLSPRIDAVFGPTLSAPPVEEAAKGLALALVFLGSVAIARRSGWYEFQGVTDGLVYGAAVGLGFAFGENLYYLVELTDLVGGPRAADIVTERVGVLGTNALGHALYTAAFGAALGATAWVRGRAAKAAVAAGGFVAATLLHAVHNGGVEALLVIRHGWDDVATWRATGAVSQPVADRLAGDEASLSGGLAIVEAGLVAACLVAGAAWLWAERRALRRQLAAEAAAGTITAEEAAAVPAFSRRFARYARLLRDGDVAGYRRRRRLDGAIVELGLRRWRGGEGADGDALDRCRARVDGARRSGSCPTENAGG
jgi:RsiW-degrading membrane proteinase PrsW (M82 family)